MNFSDTPQRYEIDLTQRYDNLSTSDLLNYRFYCDECGDPVETQERPIGENPAETLKLIEADAFKWLNYCNYCLKWVCTNCFHAFKGMCETCAALPKGQLVRKGNKEAQSFMSVPLPEDDNREVVFSSILGTVCNDCQYPLKPGMTRCPGCASEITDEIVIVEFDPADL